MQLIHNREIRILEVDFDSLTVGNEKLLVAVVVGSLVEFQVHDAAENLEEVLDDVF